ncbi:baculoviral IAP repeat-containing protein 5.1-like [Carcharodon carcharias]|uniref:baculoviral IAP repeat-containing protein 5.1-like n=1 Tax=Carcharodon carcharias TaxID=13397 RepID=UPI001B7DA861|nr:baculoviral IAP repeat-containing protein 5.1-like [Carcharodon carcharias]
MAKAEFLHCPTENEPDISNHFFSLELESWEPEDELWLQHQRHSPAYTFLALKADVLDLTVEEFFRLEMEWLKLYMKEVAAEQVSTCQESVKAATVKVLENLTNPKFNAVQKK